MKIIGINRRDIPREDGCIPDTLSVVLVVGDIDDYAAYYGVGSPEWVRDHGHKISFEEACIHFPGSLDAERYRL